MAFSVSPTSGVAPYALSAVVDNSVNVNGVDYVAAVKYATEIGSCPVIGNVPFVDAAKVDLLVTGDSVIFTQSSVPVGSCRTFTLDITRVSDGVVIASSNAEVNNV